MNENKTIQNCAVYCLAQRFNINALSNFLSDCKLISIIKGSLLIEDDESWSVVFSYGAVVHWNVDSDQKSKLHQLLMQYAESPLKIIEEENFTFEVDCPRTRIAEDHIEIESSDPKILFSLSQGMGQSIKLASFETNALTTINNFSYIPRSLAEKGAIKLSSNQIARVRGQLFLTKSDIILNYDLLDTPDFFWEYPEYEIYYSITAKYLEINQRTEVLSKKLETIHELFEMLADEQKHRQSSFLEWVIIWLIAGEICITILEKII